MTGEVVVAVEATPRLRVNDLEFDYSQIVVRCGKGAKDRVTVLPENLVEPLKRHLELVGEKHRVAIAGGFGRVELPHALARKCPATHARAHGGAITLSPLD